MTIMPGEQIMMSEESASVLWEQLVTDGHVRAARVRWMRPWLIAIALILIFVGLELQLRVRPQRGAVSGGAVMSEVDRIQAPARSAVNALPQIDVSVEDSASLVSSVELPKLIDIIMGGLASNDALPTSKVAVSQVGPAAFWTQAWSSKSLYAVDSPDVKLVGGTFNTAPANTPYYRYNPVPQRWIGVFRKKGKAWQYASLVGASLIDVPNQPSVLAELIPLTLKPVLPDSGAK